MRRLRTVASALGVLMAFASLVLIGGFVIVLLSSAYRGEAGSIESVFHLAPR